jgi:EAL domain-containing protein (putative c-di-GMP-specific phosphodiesterase class I)/ActR/RegA family two-component response regulator
MAASRLSTAAEGAARNSTVVIVDDTPANVTVLERLLSKAGVARIQGFTDPRQALAHCTESLPDLVLLDLYMPDIDGFAFMEALERVVPDGGFLPVLVLTADVSTDIKQRALGAGAKDFLTKPFDRTEVLLRVANLLETRALYRGVQAHNAELQADLDARAAAEQETAAEHQRRQHRIDDALAPGALTMVFQPVADLTTGDVVGAEALARFHCEPDRSPNEWFAEADEIGRGTELELAAIAAALNQLHQLPDTAFLAVNASPDTAATPELHALLAQHPAERIVLELTEHARIDDYGALLTALDDLRRRGVRIAVDDTGAGYAGFQHLLRLRPHILKLDITLTRGIDADPIRRSLAAALVTFATEIGATIIAEGVEIPGELTTLQHLGIPWGQGYHLARPGHLPLPALRLATLAATPHLQ